jgi:hypothetical protein
MFEKFALNDPDAAVSDILLDPRRDTDTDHCNRFILQGGGGEYEVVIGFGWSNGVALHTAGEYGQYLVSPSCPLIQVVEANGTMAGNSTAMFRGFRIPSEQ